jgi:hypothetical protein
VLEADIKMKALGKVVQSLRRPSQDCVNNSRIDLESNLSLCVTILIRLYRHDIWNDEYVHILIKVDSSKSLREQLVLSLKLSLFNGNIANFSSWPFCERFKA